MTPAIIKNNNAVALLLLAAIFQSCAHGGPPPAPQAPYAVDSTLEALKELAGLPNADVRTRAVLIQHFMAAGRLVEGLDYFERQQDPVGLAAQGLLMAQMATEIPLLERVSWVEDALSRLDQAAESSHPLVRLFRGSVSAAVPERFSRAQIAVDELQWVLAHPEAFPVSVRRGALFGLAQAYKRRGQLQRSAEALEQSGHSSLSGPAFFTDWAWTSVKGFRFTSPPRIEEVADGVWVASGYDFAEQIFIVTANGVVAIDPGSSPENARSALSALRRHIRKPITHVILTHAHEDHAGGLSAFVTAGVKLVAHHRHDEVAGRLATNPTARTFWTGGWDEPLPQPTRVVERSESIEVDGRVLDLIVSPGGETEDALLVLDRQTSTLVVGDVFMPYFGAPMIPEGSIEGALLTMSQILELKPKRLVHGHTPLTQVFTLEALPGLRTALQALLTVVDNGIRAGRSDAELISDNFVPPSLAEAPSAALPYVAMRDHLIQRRVHSKRGYWGGEQQGLRPMTRGGRPRDHAASSTRRPPTRPRPSARAPST